MSYIESVSYTHIEGEKSTPKLRMYSLSTCGFCDKARQYLTDQGFAYDYLELDSLERETKRNLKLELKNTFGTIQLLPVLTIDGTDMIAGFNEEKWAEALGK